MAAPPARPSWRNPRETHPRHPAARSAAAEKVIDGTPEELRHFLEIGRYEV
ncbi:ALF repeat-containing protein [Streptomyces sp. NPDC059080]|uniref:ALF repeat-containing protein n=1 Tax=Streptomyces sp. NPDC059080 TaxID=3346718 RepID=UPI00368856B7